MEIPVTVTVAGGRQTEKMHIGNRNFNRRLKKGRFQLIFEVHKDGYVVCKKFVRKEIIKSMYSCFQSVNSLSLVTLVLLLNKDKESLPITRHANDDIQSN